MSSAFQNYDEHRLELKLCLDFSEDLVSNEAEFEVFADSKLHYLTYQRL